MENKKNNETLQYAKELVILLEDEKTRESREIYTTINKIMKSLGPSPALIPSDLKKGLGLAYACALSETDIATKAAYVRSALSLLRAAISLAHGGERQIKDTDYYIKIIGEEIKEIEIAGEESRLDGLWSKTNRAIDYITLLMFKSGYGEINSGGFIFRKSQEPTKEITK